MKSPPQLIGVVHLLPLPGSPGYESRELVRERADRDASAYVRAGFDGIVVENFGDTPFAERVEPVVIAEMAIVVRALRLEHPELAIGVNVLRNDAQAALTIATSAEADFIRVNVHSGALLTDQGWIQGDAYQTLRLRRRLESNVQIFADVGVKHAVRPTGFDIRESARETAYRGLADALIVTGTATGNAADSEELEAVTNAVPDRRVLVGSGVNLENVPYFASRSAGVIVGTSVKVEGVTTQPVCPDRAEAFAERYRECV